LLSVGRSVAQHDTQHWSPPPKMCHSVRVRRTTFASRKLR
jgi:hypothetical protein